LFYIGCFTFAGILSDKHFTHFSLYITAIRLLTKRNISSKNLEDAKILIEHFVMQFDTIYGDDKLKYKLHSHLHLPRQVNNYGGLNTTNNFWFEGKVN
jgi:hypothetical protein